MTSVLNMTSVQRLYQDKVILVTGGTGFLGIVLIEKILRSCPDIGCIYILVREKNGLSAEDRLKALIDNTVFHRLKYEQPNFPEKLKVIQGDLLKPKLGLSQKDQDLLIQLVDVVFHSAATVRFNESVKVAIETNITATRELCYLAQEMVKLKAFVHVSTAFSNCERDFIPEEVLPPVVGAEELIVLAEHLNKDILDKVTPSLIHPKPNTYIFSKSAAENVVFNCRSSLPVAILRPAIVVASTQEPVPGWINNTQSITGIVARVSSGVMHTFLISNQDAQTNLVPVDTVVNAIIALGYAVASKSWQCSKGDNMPVVNVVAKSYNCLTYRVFFNLQQKYIYENPSFNLKWYPFFLTPEHRWSSLINKNLVHYFPANVMDFINAKSGYPTKLRKLYGRLDKFEDVLTYFTTRTFVFEEGNADRLWNLLEPQDQQLFPFNMADFNWTEYMRNYVLGCRRYLLKEDDSTLERSRLKIKWLYIIHRMSQGTLILAVLMMVRFFC